METFSTPVLNAIVKAVAQLNSRYCNQDLHQRQLHAISRCALRSTPRRPSTRCGPCLSSIWRSRPVLHRRNGVV